MLPDVKSNPSKPIPMKNVEGIIKSISRFI